MRFTAICPHCGAKDHPEPFSDQHLCLTSCGSCKRGYWFDVLENAASVEHPKDVQRNRLEALEAALRQARTVLVESAIDSIRQEAEEHRATMATYRPLRQKHLDDEVAQTEAAIDAINTLLKD